MNMLLTKKWNKSLLRLGIASILAISIMVTFQSCEFLKDAVNLDAVITVENDQPQLGEEVIVDGRESTSSGSSDLEFSWTLTAPTGSEAELEDPSSSRTSFIPDVTGDYQVELTVSSGGVETSEQVTISVTSNTLEVQGTINSDETFTSDILYRVVDDLTVSNGAKLTIEPGTRIEFESGTRFQVTSDAILSAKGTEQDSIVFTGTEAQAGWWDGIFINDTTHPENEIEYTVVEYGGNTNMHSSVGPANIVIGRSLYNAGISINNSTFRHSAEVGLYLHSNGELRNSGNNTFTKNEEEAATGYTNTLHYFDINSSYTGNSQDQVNIYGNNLSEDATWKAIEVPFVMSGESEIRDAELTIEAGAVFAFDAEAELDIGSGSIIQAQGTQQDPITFRGTVQQAGWWNGIFVNETTHPNNVFDHIIVEDAGGSAFHSSVEPANLVIGRSLYNASITVKNSVFQNSEGLGLYLHSNGEMPESESNSYTNNAEGPVSVATNNLHYLDSNSTFAGNEEGNDYAWVRGNNLSSDATWQPLDVPYGMTGESSISESAIEIEPGASFAFDAEASLIFGSGSEIQVVGTSDDPIMFTGTQETPGWWKGIFVSQTTHPDNAFEHVVIEYGGNSEFHSSVVPANLAIGRSLYDASLTVTNSTIQNSDGVGIYVDANGSTNSDICSVNTFNSNATADCTVE